MTRILSATAASLLLALSGGCAYRAGERPPGASTAEIESDIAIAAFSGRAAGGLPARWAPMIIHRNKQRTRYQLVSENEKTILHARAASASSALMQHVSIDPYALPWLNWHWRIASLIDGADNTQRHAEDSPVRLILGFDGDKDTMPFNDQILFETARIMTGHDFPYATLMYIWENKAAVGTVIDSTRSSRIKMMVAASGADGVARWREFTRNIVEDFEQAFGEKPGRLIAVGVLTDTDNTGETVEAWYGDIRSFKERRLATPGN